MQFDKKGDDEQTGMVFFTSRQQMAPCNDKNNAKKYLIDIKKRSNKA